eukprot:jgi/Pico_ML_1/55349/g1047.t1
MSKKRRKDGMLSKLRPVSPKSKHALAFGTRKAHVMRAALQKLSEKKHAPHASPLRQGDLKREDSNPAGAEKGDVRLRLAPHVATWENADISAVRQAEALMASSAPEGGERDWPGVDVALEEKLREVRHSFVRPCQVRLLNYRKDGSTFWNLLYIAPVFGEGGKLATCFVGVQTEVEAPEGAEDLMEEEGTLCEGDAVVKITGALKELGPKGEDVEKETGKLRSPLLLALMTVQQSFVLVDAKAKDMPIVHASQQFCAMCGYPEREVLGRNCRFLQGEGTCREDVEKVTDAIKRKKPVTVRLLNYRKDGTPFWNSLHIAPIRNADGEVEFFIGVQIDVTAADAFEPKQPEAVTMEERLKHSGAVGAVRVAVRAQSGHEGEGLSRCL